MPLFKNSSILFQIFLIAFLTLLFKQHVSAQCMPLSNGFAHNDYWHKHPLFDAIANGYTNIEADVYNRDGNLVVAHILPVLNRHRTLENLYFKPLYNYMVKNQGTVYPGYHAPITLMIDIKSDGDKTYLVLKKLLEKYGEMLSSYANDTIHLKMVTVVLSGHKPIKLLNAENQRFAFVDEDLRLIHRDSTFNMYTMASCKYSKMLGWRGFGSIPALQKERLQSFVLAAHKYGRKVRLWASPDNAEVWKTLLDCGVDLINTDKLEQLKNFLIKDKQLLAVSSK